MSAEYRFRFDDDFVVAAFTRYWRLRWWHRWMRRAAQRRASSSAAVSGNQWNTLGPWNSIRPSEKGREHPVK